MPRRAGDLAARSLQSQSDLYSRSRSRGEIATVSARSRAASALINSRHRLAHRLRHRHTGARGDTGRGCRRGPRRRDGRRRRRLNGARRVLDETHSFFMRRLSADYLGGTSCQRVRCPIKLRLTAGAGGHIIKYIRMDLADSAPLTPPEACTPPDPEQPETQKPRREGTVAESQDASADAGQDASGLFQG